MASDWSILINNPISSLISLVNSFAVFYKNRLWRNEVRSKVKDIFDL